MTVMRAIRFHAWGEPPIVEEIPVPVPGEGETLVRVEAAAIAHLDLTVASGRFGIKPELPYTGGVEGCGVVVESDLIEPGTRVVLRGGGLGLLRAGTWAEYVVAKTKTLTPTVDGLSPEQGATFFVPSTTAHLALHAVARLGGWGVDGVDLPSDEVVVVGGAAGAVGSLVAQLALLAGCSVIGAVGAEDQIDLLPKEVEPVVLSDKSRMDQLAEQRGASLLVDTLGGPDVLARTRWVRPGGRAVLIGYVAGEDIAIHLPHWLLDDVALLPLNMIRREREARTAAPPLAAMIANGDLRLSLETFGFEEAAVAVDRLAAGGLRGRGVLLPGPAQ